MIGAEPAVYEAASGYAARYKLVDYPFGAPFRQIILASGAAKVCGVPLHQECVVGYAVQGGGYGIEPPPFRWQQIVAVGYEAQIVEQKYDASISGGNFEGAASCWGYRR
jgi:hypothetical protein